MKSLKPKVFFVILFLLGINIVLLISNYKTNQKKTAIAIERAELIEERDSLIGSLGEIQSRLTQELGLNATLNRLVEQKTSEIDSIRRSYRSKLYQSELSNTSLKEMLATAKVSIDSLRLNYDNQIASLNSQLEVAELENNELKKEVSTQKETIASLKKDLDIAELFRLDDVYINPVAVSGSRRRSTTIAQRVEELEICLDIASNQLLPAGKHEILVRILNPDGATLAIQSNGSGTFTLAKEKRNSLFSKKISVEYSPGKPIEICTNWLQSFPFKAGKYVAEVYHKGYLVKTGEITLRNKTLF